MSVARIQRLAQHLSTADGGYALELLAELQEEARNELHPRVNNLRCDGWSWSEIGQALGISKQAAQQRYGA